MKVLEVNCSVCGQKEWRLLGVSTLLVQHNQDIATNIYECKHCGVLFREAGQDGGGEHFQTVGYTPPQNENENRRMRIGYFEYLSSLLGRHVRPKPDAKVLDIGCSYGHFLDVMRQKGFKTSGIEINETLYQRLKKEGIHEVFRTMQEVQGKFDIVTLIDSLYCVEDPLKVLKESKDCLTEDGVILCRVTNRVWLIKMFLALQKGRPIPRSLTGDARWSFSPRSLKILFSRAGFSDFEFIFAEKEKKGLPMWKTMFYSLTGTVSSFTPLKVSPGIIVIARNRADP